MAASERSLRELIEKWLDATVQRRRAFSCRHLRVEAWGVASVSRRSARLARSPYFSFDTATVSGTCFRLTSGRP